jgi:hypothetical protein
MTAPISSGREAQVWRKPSGEGVFRGQSSRHPAKGIAASFTSSRIREKGMGTDRDRAWRACRSIKEEASP